MTEAERGLVEQAALLQFRVEQLREDAIAGKQINDSELIRLAGASRRALSKIVTKAKPATTETLPEYLARRAAEQAAADDEGDDDGS